MILITPEDGPSGLADSICALKRQLVHIRTGLDGVHARIMDGDFDQVANATKAASEIRHWIRVALELEVQLEKQRNRERGIVNGYAIDFDEARSAISGRLDRLRRAGGGNGVPGEPEQG